jgi:hypothetical protein
MTAEPLTGPGLAALQAERKARKEAEREVAELRKFRRKFFEMRDRAELWEARAIRYSNQLKQQKINNA